MGLFDGIGTEGLGSTAELAALLGWPVILVLDARGTSSSLAATLAGFARHKPGLAVAGYIVNRVGSIDHADIIARACAEACPWIGLIGCVPRDTGLVLPSRHLGLVQATERPDLEAFIDAAADLIERHLDLEALIALVRPAHAPPSGEVIDSAPLGQRIAVAQDEAFAFCYRRVLDDWRASGAELHLFSPLADQKPDESADAVYLPGGYPELHAGRLAGNETFLSGLKKAADRGAAIYGECGGYMVLGRALIDADGAEHAMAGLLPLVTSFATPHLNLGYRRARLDGDCALGRSGTLFRGHEFHYATIVEEGPGDPLFQASDAQGRRSFAAGLREGSVMGSFIHLIDGAVE
jgi:cobyrinic acid a,c-diamide synthase